MKQAEVLVSWEQQLIATRTRRASYVKQAEVFVSWEHGDIAPTPSGDYARGTAGDGDVDDLTDSPGEIGERVDPCQGKPTNDVVRPTRTQGAARAR